MVSHRFKLWPQQHEFALGPMTGKFNSCASAGIQCFIRRKDATTQFSYDPYSPGHDITNGFVWHFSGKTLSSENPPVNRSSRCSWMSAWWVSTSSPCSRLTTNVVADERFKIIDGQIQRTSNHVAFKTPSEQVADRGIVSIFRKKRDNSFPLKQAEKRDNNNWTKKNSHTRTLNQLSTFIMNH